MFSSLRNYSKHIDESQRFNYDTYQYYNIYENLDKNYTTDLSKYIYHCTRRSTPLIILYGQNKLLRLNHSRYINKQDKLYNMELFLYNFVNTFIQNNYSGAAKAFQKEPGVEYFQLRHFCTIADLKYDNQYIWFKMPMISKTDLSALFGSLSQTCRQKLSSLQTQYSLTQQNKLPNISNIQFLYGIQLYCQKILTDNYVNIQVDSFLLYYQFVVQIHRLIFDIVNCRIRTILLIAYPKLKLLNTIIHPLLIPILSYNKLQIKKIPKNTTLQTSQLYKIMSSLPTHKPKIVFINLDGKQNLHNIQYIANLQQQILYISLYHQPSWIQKKQTIMQNLFHSSDHHFIPSYSKYWQIYSQAIIKQFHLSKKSISSKILLFPLNSSYLMKKYIQQIFQDNINNKQKSTYNTNKFYNIQSSQNINLLFQYIIYQEIRKYYPTIIFISYNAQLNIIEDHFSNIVKNCSIIADHRVVLFPNLTHLFQEDEFFVEKEEDKGEKIMCAYEFYQKYYNYKFQNINQQRFYSNITTFLKHGSGLYKMSDRQSIPPSTKQSTPKFYSYLDTLSKIIEFKWIQKYQIKKWKSNQLNNLYQQYLTYQIKQNKKQNKYYQKMITTVIAQLICKNIDQSKLESILDKKLLFRLKFIVEELVKEYEQFKKMETKVNVFRINSPDFQMSKQMKVKILQDYLLSEKQRLLLQNFQNYKIRKSFYLDQSNKSTSTVICFKFVLINGEEIQQVYLQKYSQVIVNQDKSEIFIINYKGIDNRHMILHGNFKNLESQKDVVVSQVKQTDRELSEEVKQYFQHHYLSEEGLRNQRQDNVFIQYNHCLHHETLYLYWPLMWNLKQETRYKILGCQYKAKRVFKMIKVFKSESQFQYENLLYQPSQDGIQILARWGCSSKALSDNSFVIFGGIFDSENDFKMIGSGIYRVEIKQTSKYKAFTIYSEPKSKNKNESVLCLKPKINYVVKTCKEIDEEGRSIIYGGYGRQGTSFYNLFSYDQYYLDSSLKLSRSPETKYPRSLVKPQIPLQINKIGKYTIIQNDNNIALMDEKYTDALKNKFIFQKKIDSNVKINQLQIISFIDDNYRINQFKTYHKKLFLFGFDRTVRQRIYLKCWSPELYILDGVKQYIVNIALKTQKTSNYIITNYLMPRQQDIISLCLQEDKLYLLQNSPIINSIQQKKVRYVLYEGSFLNINEIMYKKEIQMVGKYYFDQKYQKYLYNKTVFVQENQIYLVGGSGYTYDMMGENRCERQDYILFPNKNKTQIKIRKIDITSFSLQMPKSVIMKQNDYYLIYSIIFEDNPNQIDLKQNIQWKIKIQKHFFNNNQGNQVKCGGLWIYVYNKNIQKIQKYPHSNLCQPKFVKIIPYHRFDLSVVRQIILKIMVKLGKNQQIAKKQNKFYIINQLHNQTNNKALEGLLASRWLELDELINVITGKLEEGEQITYQQQQLLKDLKSLYYLSSKMIIQHHIFLQQHHQRQYIYILQDKSSKKVKYLAIGPLNTTKLNFFKIRFNHQIFINLNYQQNCQIFYHPTIHGYYLFQYENVKQGDCTLYTQQEFCKTLNVTIKQ